MPVKFPNVRYIGTNDVFCDQAVCRPFGNNDVLYSDAHHVSPAGADRSYDAFQSDFLWLVGKE
jgi:SGNH domain (fused to AT3 domains)